MNSREKILEAVKANQPQKEPLPDIRVFERNASGSIQQFTDILKSIGGQVHYVHSFDEISPVIFSYYGKTKRIISVMPELAGFNNEGLSEINPLDLSDVEVAIIKGRIGVAENGSVWITESEMGQRVLPFICQHLSVVLDSDSIVPTMHEAYELIEKTTYGFGTFIAGPSKTADIEQSLVIGAHGPRSMTVFLMMKNQLAG